MRRIYDLILKEHFSAENKMAFIAGPRQVGKTTTAIQALPNNCYLNWDNQEHRKIILNGPASVVHFSGGDKVCKKKIPLIFDELHKYPKWKNFLKGFFDTYHNRFNICVMGSARLDVFKHGGDSMMGRYFFYRMHPLSIRELSTPALKTSEISNPVKISDTDFDNLVHFGGYPEPYLRSENRFYNKWKRLRLEQLFNEDIRDIARITDIGRVKVLADRLIDCASSTINYSHIANDIQVSVDTVRRWISLLESIYYSFRIRPYSKNIARSLLKEPKVYLWDWALIPHGGKRNENFVASHLLKAVHYYTDMGFGDYDLFYLRDKSQREVDFLITKDNLPWILIEVKTGDGPISDSLRYFQKITKAKHAFQAIFDYSYERVNCFKDGNPIKVPVKTLLSQLV